MINLASWCRLSPNIKVICVPLIWFTLVCVLCYRLFNVLLICCSYYELNQQLCFPTSLFPNLSLFYVSLSLSRSVAILLFSISHSLGFANIFNIVYIFNLHPFPYIITHDEIVIHIILKPISSAWIYNEESTITQTNMFCIEMGKTAKFVAAYWSCACTIEVPDDIYFWETSHTCKFNS